MFYLQEIWLRSSRLYVWDDGELIYFEVSSNGCLIQSERTRIIRFSSYLISSKTCISFGLYQSELFWWRLSFFRCLVNYYYLYYGHSQKPSFISFFLIASASFDFRWVCQSCYASQLLTFKLSSVGLSSVERGSDPQMELNFHQIVI